MTTTQNGPPVEASGADQMRWFLMDGPFTNRAEVTRWLIYGTALFLLTLTPLVFGPDEPLLDEATVSMTMAFAVMAFGTLATGLAVRRDPDFGLLPPVLKALGILAIAAGLTIVATNWDFLQDLLGTTELTSDQWLAVLGLSIIVFIVVESEKWIRQRLHERSEAQNPAASAAEALQPVSAGAHSG